MSMRDDIEKFLNDVQSARTRLPIMNADDEAFTSGLEAAGEIIQNILNRYPAERSRFPEHSDELWEAYAEEYAKNEGLR